MRLLAAVVPFICLAGCATARSASQPDLVVAIGDRFVGRSVTEMADLYGPPGEERPRGDKRILVWNERKDFLRKIPVNSTTRGTLGTGNPADGSVRYIERTTSQQAVAVPLTCKLFAYVDTSNAVLDVYVDGDTGACERFRP